MSRIGKLPITVPSGVDVNIDGQAVSVKGPKGTLSLNIAEPIIIEKADDGTLEVKRPNDERRSRSLHGLSRTLVQNMVVGVTQGYEKKMEIHGVGYRVALKGSDLKMGDSWGVAAQLGADFKINERWFMNADIRYIDIKSKVKLDGQHIGTARIDPWVATLGVGYRF